MKHRIWAHLDGWLQGDEEAWNAFINNNDCSELEFIPAEDKTGFIGSADNNEAFFDGKDLADREIEGVRIKDVADETSSTSCSKDRTKAMLQMERELIDVVHEQGDDGVLLLDDLAMAWSEECDGDIYTKDIEALEVRQSWDEGVYLVVNMNGELVPFNECDQNDLGHNLADYIYEEVKAYY